MKKIIYTDKNFNIINKEKAIFKFIIDLKNNELISEEIWKIKK